MGSRIPPEGTPGTTTNVKTFETTASISRSHGDSYRYATCPFCDTEIRIRESSLNSKGKRCACGAVLTHRRGGLPRATLTRYDRDITTQTQETTHG